MLPDRWYPILESRRLRRRPVGVRRLGRPLVLWRDAAGAPRAASSVCPHRGADLADGRVIDGELVCPWHGFRFDGEGACTRIPCEGDDARIPKGMRIGVFELRDQHGLVWMWHGERRADYPDVPYFEEESGLRGTTELSYELPYHYSRMVETNLDMHHTPFVHGSVFPTGEIVRGFEAELDGDRIRTRGELCREGRDSGFLFEVDALLPCLGRIEFGRGLRIIVAATPVDEQHSWLWFRYYQDWTRNPVLGKIITWVAVKSEQRIVQRQDWRVFRGLAPGTIDDFPYRFVQADEGIALYRKRRAQLLAESHATEAQEPRARAS